MDILKIKQAILRMNDSKFQDLCATYLSKKMNLDTTITSLGSCSDAEKTTKGTPDTYFTLQNGKFIYVEYTTQRSNIFRKLDSDIDKCLDDGKINGKLYKIICIHLSSNITANQTNELSEKCKSQNVILELIGIDQLAMDIYNKYPILAQDYLGIELTTNQIQEIEDFISYYNKHPLSASLNTEFKFREKEIEEIEDKFKNSNLVILKGDAGIGKTRLAIEVARIYEKKHGYTSYCIHSENLPIWNDLTYYFENASEYFIFIDDANELSELNNVFSFIKSHTNDYKFKVLISVRKYALDNICKTICSKEKFEIVEINKFSDGQIKTLVENEYGIKEPSFINQIIRIAEGNARIAILAGKVVSENCSFSEIQNASNLYDKYYGGFLDKEISLDENMYKVAGIVCFFDHIYFKEIDKLNPILEEYKITQDDFKKNVRKLHDKEILDIYKDKLINSSEQCLSNYLLKLVFIDKKLLSFSKMIKFAFPFSQDRTREVVQTLLELYRTEEIQKFIKDSINAVWNEFEKENSKYFNDFFSSFYLLNPTKALIILKDRIKKVDNVVPDKDKFNLSLSSYRISDDILCCLKGFCEEDDFKSALDLMFCYFKKNPNLYSEFYNIICSTFSIKANSHIFNYRHQIIFIKKIIEESNNWHDRLITLLFLDISKEFLRLTYNPAESDGRKSLRIYNIALDLHDGVKTYRELVWQSLIKLCNEPMYVDKVVDVLFSYDTPTNNVSYSVVEFDAKFIKLLLEKVDKLGFKVFLLIDKFKKIFKQANVKDLDFFNKYLNMEEYKIYSFLMYPTKEKIKNNKYDGEQLNLKLNLFVKTHTIEDFKKIIDVCKTVDEYKNNYSWYYEIKDSLVSLFEIIYEQKEVYIELIKYYLESNTPLDLQADLLLDKLFCFLTDEELFNLISSIDFSKKKQWLISFYSCMPKEYLSKQNLNNLYYALNDLDLTVDFSIMKFDKYNKIDKNAFMNICEIVLENIKLNKININCICCIFYDNDEQVIINKFKKHFNLLEEIYFITNIKMNYFDIDYKFLIAFSKVYPKVLDKFISKVINDSDDLLENHKIEHLLDFDNYIDVLNDIFVGLVKSENSYRLVYYSSHKGFLDKDYATDKRDNWIKQLISKYNDDKDIMRKLFVVIVNLELKDRKKYVKWLIEKNDSIEIFSNLYFNPTFLSCSKSEIPILQTRKEYFLSLLDLFNGIKWIEHKNFIENLIRDLESDIEKAEMQDLIMK